MSQTNFAMRWARGAVAAGIVSGAVLFVTSSPASANTNFNASCESSEACVWDGDIYEGWLWDYESTDTNFTNNYYPKGGPLLDNTGTGFENRGLSCTAVFGQNVGGPSSQGWTIRLARGATYEAYWTYKNNAASSLWWEC